MTKTRIGAVVSGLEKAGNIVILFSGIESALFLHINPQQCSGYRDGSITPERPQMRSALIFATLLLLLPNLSHATSISVPNDFNTIQMAIDSAAAGDSILIEPGNYNENVIVDSKQLVIGSRYLDTGDESYIARTIINGGGAERVIRLRNGLDSTTQVVGLTLTNGRAQYGAGVHILTASPKLKHLVIRRNTATSNGGGVYVTRDAHPVFDQVSVVANTGQTYGGINLYGGSTCIIRNSIFWSNDPQTRPDSIVVSYSDMEAGEAGDGNVNSDPQFTDAQNNDFTLAVGSPCINSADPDRDDPDGTQLDMGAISYFHQPVIAVTPARLDFNGVHLNQNIEHIVSVRNAGEVPLTVQALRVVGANSPFSITQGGARVVLNSGDISRTTIRYTPVQVPAVVDTLIISSNDPANSRIALELTGFGIAPTPDIQSDRARLEYGDIALGANNSINVTLTNAGDAVLTVSTVRVESQDSSQFTTNFQNAVNVQAGGQSVIAVRFAPTRLGQMAGALVISSNDADTPTLRLNITANAVRPQRRYNFTDNTGANCSILILDATIDNHQLGFLSEIAVFTPGGLCVGGDFWVNDTLGMAAWADNEMTQAVDGFRDGEAMSFKYWDITSQQELAPRMSLVEGDANFTPNGITVIRLNADVGQRSFKVYTGNGWTIVSAPISPAERNIVNLWQPVRARNHLTMIKDANGRFYVPAINFSNLPPWDFHQGYLVRGNAVDSLEIAGDPVAANEAIPLRNGWTIAAYFPEQSVDVRIAVRNAINNITRVKDANGRFYVPAINFSNMLPLRRGQGYYVQANAAVNLVWNINQRDVQAAGAVETNPVHYPVVAPSSASMSVLLTGEAGWSGSEVAVFTQTGRLVGSAALSGSGPWGLAVWNDDPTTESVDGASEGEKLLVKVYRSGFESEAGSLAFVADELAELSLPPSVLPLKLTLAEASPNPFNSRTEIRYTIPYAQVIKLVVFDQAGREIATLVNGTSLSGEHSVTWNAEGVPSGVYIVQLSAGADHQSIKLALVR